MPSARTPTSRLRMTSSPTSRLKARTPLTSRSSYPRPRSTTATATHPTTSPPKTGTARRPSVIRDAMKKKKMVGIARVVMARRERVMMLEPFGKGIMGTTLHYPYEIRSDEAVFEEIPEMKLPDQMIGLAEDIIDKMTRQFEPDRFEDLYESAMIALIRSKQEGLPAPKEKPAARPANVVNLMDALRRSVESECGKGKSAKAPPAKKAEPAARPKRKAAKG